MDILLGLHIAGGTVAILAGFPALFARKGGAFHRAAGLVFFASMIVMAGFGEIVAIQRSQQLNMLAAAFTLYLVATAWLTVWRKPGSVGRAEVAAALFAAAVAAMGLLFTLQASRSQFAATYGMFAGLSALAAALDWRVIRRGGVTGPDRVARHLWRMCLALFVAAASFFFGQADEIPEALRGPHLAIPPLTALAVMLYYLVRVRRRATRRSGAPA